MSLRFYLDEDVDIALASALNNRGADSITTLKTENTGNTDLQQLIYAKEQNRILITHNIKDFILLHKEFTEAKREHSGIALSNQLPIGMLLKRVMKLNAALDEEDMKSRIEFLSNWR